MKITEIRQMSTEEIKAEVDDTREELMRFRFQRATGELVNHNQIRMARRKIARLLTVLNERKVEEEASLEGES